MPWGVAAAAVGALGSYEAAKVSSKGGSGGGSSNQYVPTDLSGADQGWQDAFNGQQGVVNQTAGSVNPMFAASFANGMDPNYVNYSGYMNGAVGAGQVYGDTATMANNQVGGYLQQAEQARQQQQQMYGAGAQVMNTAMDPQNALYDRTAQHLQDQVRAGQAARGLGNSAQGAGEEDQAMSNFNIDWQNNQLARQTQGLQANVNANAAGANQGRMYGADQTAAIGAGATAAGYYQQAGQIPLAAQQYVTQQPAALASAYATEMSGVQQMYGNEQGAAIPYMNAGNGAIQGNYNNAYTANRDMAGGISQMAGAAGNALQNNWGNWFGGGNSGVPQNPYDPSTGASYSPSSYTSMGGGDSYYGAGMNWGV